MKLLMSLGMFYPSQIGGPGNTLYWIGKELVKKDIAVTVVVSDIGVPADFAVRNKWFNLDNIKIKYCSTNAVNSSIKLTWNTLKEVSRNDLIMLSSIFYKPNFFVGILTLILGKRIIWSPRGEFLIPRGFIKNSYIKIIKYFFAKRAIFHATSKEEEDSIRNFLGEKVQTVLIPNYMELPQKMEEERNENYLLYVGRIMPIKALEKLIEGISLSRNFLESDYKLYLAGKNEGIYYQELLSLIASKNLQDKIIFKGMVVGLEKEKLYANAKATFLVSHSENFGNVIIESLAQGTPAVCSKATPWENLNNYGAGFWIDNSPQIIADTIDELLLMPEEKYENMRKKAYQLCCNEFDITANIDEWVKILKLNANV